MSNVCNTVYAFIGKKEDMKSLLVFLGYARANGWYNYGSISAAMKIPAKSDKRGDVLDFTYETLPDRRVKLIVDADEAWNAHDAFWREVLAELELSEKVSMSFYAIEPGCGYFVKHDPENVFGVDYYVSAGENAAIKEGTYSAEALLSALRGLFGDENDELEDLIEKAEDGGEDEDAFVSIYALDEV